MFSLTIGFKDLLMFIEQEKTHSKYLVIGPG